MNEIINLDSLNERLNKLEKSNRMFKNLVILMSVVLIVIPLVGWQVTTQYFKVIETEKLVLKDSNGRERAVLLMDGDNPKLRFKDNNDNILLSTGIIDSTPYLRLFRDDRALINLEIQNSNLPLIALNRFNQEKTEIVEFQYLRPGGIIISKDDGTITLGTRYVYSGDIELSVTQTNQLIFEDKNDVEILSLGFYDEDNTPHLKMKDKSNTLRNLIVADGLFIFDQYGKNRINLMLNEYSSPTLHLLDNNERNRTVIGSTQIKYNDGSIKTTAESSIWLFDQNGSGLFTAPNK